MFASSGSSVKLWNEKNFQILQDLNNNSGIIPAISWNKDGQILSAFYQNTSEVSLYTVDSGSAVCSGLFRISGIATCLEFCKTNSRYLAIGDSKDQVLIWDVKSNYKKKSYTVPKSCITNLSFSSSDSHLAVGTVHGEAFTISNTNNLVSSPIKVFLEKTEVKDIRYSIFNRSIVGACGENGNVALYDSNTSKVVVRHNSHSAPVSSIAFSPTNELLMISVGYDKRLISYDANTKSIVMKCDTEDPLTCISFMGNGQSVAVGTMTGEVIAYDLRILSHPLYKTMAYSGPVYDLKFQPSFPIDKLKMSKRKTKNIAANEDKIEADLKDQPRLMKTKEDSVISNHTELNVPPTFEILSPVNFQVSQKKELPKFQNIPLLKSMKTPARLAPAKQIKEFADLGLLSPLDKENRSPFGKVKLSAKPLIMDGLLSPLEGSPRSNASSAVKSSVNDSVHQEINSLEKNFQNISSGLLSPLECSPRSKSSAAVKSGGNSSVCKEINSFEKIAPDLDDLLSPLKVDAVQKTLNSQKEFASASKVNLVKCFSHEMIPNLSTEKVKKNLLKDLEMKSTSPAKKNSSLQLGYFDDKNKDETLKERNEARDEKLEDAFLIAFPRGDSELEIFPTLDDKSTKLEVGLGKHTENKRKEEVLHTIQTETDSQTISQSAIDEFNSIRASMTANSEIKMCIAEALKEYDCKIEDRFLNIQFTVVRQTLNMMRELKEYIKEHSLNEELLLENEKLKDEIQRLRCIY